jgi:hypothetical protein
MGQAFTKDDDIGPKGIISSPPYSFSNLVGTWTNLNLNSRSILKIVISETSFGLKITPYYAMGGVPFSWGSIYARVYGKSIDASDGVAFTAEKNFGFEEEIIVGWRSGSYLKVTLFTMFTDDSSRSNSFISETFRKIS